jgi:hypothetical protein
MTAEIDTLADAWPTHARADLTATLNAAPLSVLLTLAWVPEEERSGDLTLDILRGVVSTLDAVMTQVANLRDAPEPDPEIALNEIHRLRERVLVAREIIRRERGAEPDATPAAQRHDTRSNLWRARREARAKREARTEPPAK